MKAFRIDPDRKVTAVTLPDTDGGRMDEVRRTMGNSPTLIALMHPGSEIDTALMAAGPSGVVNPVGCHFARRFAGIPFKPTGAVFVWGLNEEGEACDLSQLWLDEIGVAARDAVHPPVRVKYPDGEVLSRHVRAPGGYDVVIVQTIEGDATDAPGFVFPWAARAVGVDPTKCVYLDLDKGHLDLIEFAGGVIDGVGFGVAWQACTDPAGILGDEWQEHIHVFTPAEIAAI